jgi:hypothetical protein
MSDSQRLRAFTAEMLEGAARSASISIQFLEIGDDVGAEYALRRCTAHLRVAVTAMAKLKEHKARPEVADAG